jgi:hypothetical protein
MTMRVTPITRHRDSAETTVEARAYEAVEEIM